MLAIKSKPIVSDSSARTAPAFCLADTAEGRPLRVLWIWHAAVIAEYQKPVDLLGRCPDLEMALLVPNRWPERAGQVVAAEELPARSFRLIKSRTLFTGLYYIYFFPALIVHLLRFKPDIIYCYEEAHTLLSAMVLLARRLLLRRTEVLLYAAQNIRKRYPPPFTMLERYCFRRADGIIACGVEVAKTLRAKGYERALRVVPLPVDEVAFSPSPEKRAAGRDRLGIPADTVLVGYAGKLVEEKGLRTLFDAFRQVAPGRPDLHLALAGGGPLLEELQASASQAGLDGRVHLPGVIHNSGLPEFMNALDIFVLPSETRPNWREQFGRVLVEAMSCRVAVIGSSSGEIPEVLADAGIVFPEGDAQQLAAAIRKLQDDPAMRASCARRGRERVLQLFTTERVAAQHYTIYKHLLPAREQKEA